VLSARSRFSAMSFKGDKETLASPPEGDQSVQGSAESASIS
jgi:hypothetical protein